MLVYLSDHAASQMVGGELLLHASPWVRWMRPAIVLTPIENRMLAFPCMDRSYHSVSRITSMAQPRNYIQVQISSSVDIWPRGRCPAS
jgi:hypothetical protein